MIDEKLQREYNPPKLFILEEVEIGGGYHKLNIVHSGPVSDWSEPYKKSGIAEYRYRIIEVPYPPEPIKYAQKSADLKKRLHDVAHILTEEIGASGPENADSVAKRAVGCIRKLESALKVEQALRATAEASFANESRELSAAKFTIDANMKRIQELEEERDAFKNGCEYWKNVRNENEILKGRVRDLESGYSKTSALIAAEVRVKELEEQAKARAFASIEQRGRDVDVRDNLRLAANVLEDTVKICSSIDCGKYVSAEAISKLTRRARSVLQAIKGTPSAH